MTEPGPQRFTGKVAFVTVGGSGIGRETALAFAAEGAAVAVAGIPEDDVAETARLIEQCGGRPLAPICDVTSDTHVRTRWTGQSRLSGGWTLRPTTPGWSSRTPRSRT